MKKLQLFAVILFVIFISLSTKSYSYELYGFGSNEDGQLGVGGNIWSIGNETNWISVSCGDSHSLALKKMVLYGLGDRILSDSLGTAQQSINTIQYKLAQIMIGTSFPVALLIPLQLKRMEHYGAGVPIITTNLVTVQVK